MRGDRLGGPPGALLLARAGAKWRPQPATCGPWYWRCPLSHVSPLPSAVAFPASGAWLCWSLENCTGSERDRPRTSPVVVGGVTIIQPTIHLTRNETIVARQRHTTITVAPRCRRAEIATAQTIS